MGKGKGKPSKRAEKTAIKAAKKETRRKIREERALTRPQKPKPERREGEDMLSLKRANKALAKAKQVENRALRKAKKGASEGGVLGAGGAVRGGNGGAGEGANVQALGGPKAHAKWPAMFKRHLGLLESHIRSLDRVMQSMKSVMNELSEKERERWELGEGGKWRLICGLMDRSREILVQARMSAKGILPDNLLRDKKGLGVAGITFEPLLPKLEARAAELGYDKMSFDANMDIKPKMDVEGDNEMSDASLSSGDSDSDLSIDSDSESNSDAEDKMKTNGKEATPSIPATEDRDESTEKSTHGTADVEPNPYFVVDTKPTPVTIHTNGTVTTKKIKKRPKDSESEGDKKSKKTKKKASAVPETIPTEQEPRTDKKKKRTLSSSNSAEDVSELVKSKKSKSTAETSPPAPESSVDFHAIQAQLLAEVSAAEAEKEASSLRKSDKKKRRRSSDGVGGDVVEKKIKGEKKEKKRKAEEGDGGVGEKKKRRGVA